MERMGKSSLLVEEPGSRGALLTTANWPVPLDKGGNNPIVEESNQAVSVANRPHKRQPQLDPNGSVSNSSKFTQETEDESTLSSNQHNLQTNQSADPFAPRIGRTLYWKKVNMTLKGNSRRPERKLLDNVWGSVPPKQVTAIMGASGAGKSSLLNVLSGRVKRNRRITVESEVRLDQAIVDPTSKSVRKMIAFVEQEDSLHSTTTPREAIRFSARLRLSRTMTGAEIDQLVDTMLKDLGLLGCADTVIGGPLLSGISGGERKRTSVGCELVVKPALIFLDEATSGLDSFSATQLCQVLKKVANAGASVLCTIHQPNSFVFNSFDHLLLLHLGRVLYEAPVRNVKRYFAAKGFSCPKDHNLADWIVHVAQNNTVLELEDKGFFSGDEMLLPPSWDSESQTESEEFEGKEPEMPPPGFRAQLRMLLKREYYHVRRFPYPQYARFGLTAIISIMIGTIYFGVGEEPVTDTFILQSQFGAMMILLMFAMLGTAQSTLLFFPEERPIFLREYSTGHFSVFSYLVSQLIVEASNTAVQVFLLVTLMHTMVGFRGSILLYYVTTYTLALSGAAIAVLLAVLSKGNGKVAQEMLPVVFFPQLLFSGFFVSMDLVPTWLQWMQKTSVLSYAVRLLAVEEFLDCSKVEEEQLLCQGLVDNLDADPDMKIYYWAVLVVYFAVFRVIALVCLRSAASKFQ